MHGITEKPETKDFDTSQGTVLEIPSRNVIRIFLKTDIFFCVSFRSRFSGIKIESSRKRIFSNVMMSYIESNKSGVNRCIRAPDMLCKGRYFISIALAHSCCLAKTI